MSSKGITHHPHVFWVNYPDQVGFLVKFGRHRKRVHKIFLRHKFTSKEECFKKACQFADQFDRKYPLLNRREVAQVVRRKTGSGIIGVRKKISKVKGHEYEFWEANWSPQKNIVRKKSFSVLKYGGLEARKLAIKYRRTGLAEMEL